MKRDVERKQNNFTENNLIEFCSYRRCIIDDNISEQDSTQDLNTTCQFQQCESVPHISARDTVKYLIQEVHTPAHETCVSGFISIGNSTYDILMPLYLPPCLVLVGATRESQPEYFAWEIACFKHRWFSISNAKSASSNEQFCASYHDTMYDTSSVPEV